jgi:hypothetical protein
MSTLIIPFNLVPYAHVSSSPATSASRNSRTKSPTMVALCVAFQRRNGREGRGGRRDGTGVGTVALGGATDTDVGGGGGATLTLCRRSSSGYTRLLWHMPTARKRCVSHCFSRSTRALCVCTSSSALASSMFFIPFCSAVMVFDEMSRSAIAHLDRSAYGFYRSCFGANHQSKDAIPNDERPANFSGD